MTQTKSTNDKLESLAQSEKKPYDAPVLSNLGDVRDLTLGGSPGTGDSGNAGTQQF